MTLLEIKNQLISFFIKNDTFTLKDIKNIKVSKNQEDMKQEIVLSILEDMEKDGIIKKITKSVNEIIFVNVYPQTMIGQNIEISGQTADLIGEIVNQFNESSNNLEYVVDKTKISEFDIQQLAMITAQLLNGLDEENND